MVVIVKVQIPLATNGPKGLALVYAKGKVGMAQQALTADTLRQMKGDVKAFFEAQRHISGFKWIIGDRVEDQDW